MVDIDIQYEGDLHCGAVHRPSKTAMTTDAPVDNQGRGGSFSPTDLVATALGTCMATTMNIFGRRKNYSDLTGLRVHVQKHMTSAPPRRIARLTVELTIPAATARAFDANARAELENAANTCPVRLSLVEALEVPVVFDWQG